jgi:phage antirepressor YoqD-like protein
MNYMNMQDTYTNAANNRIASAFIIANGSPLFHQVKGQSEDYTLDTATPITMRSLEIAELTGKNHADVMRDIRKMRGDLGGDIGRKFAGYYNASNGKHNPCYNLQRWEVDILLTGYSTTMRAAVIDRWRDLEYQANNTPFTVPNALYNALKLATDLEGEREALTGLVKVLESQIKRDAAKVEFYDDIADTKELFNTGVVAKTLGTGKTKFLNYLREHKILMGSGNKRNLPYQRHLDAGRLEVKWIMGTDRRTGERFHKPVPLFTGKGILWIKQFVQQNGHCGL